jgi:hypothetical protein
VVERYRVAGWWAFEGDVIGKPKKEVAEGGGRGWSRKKERGRARRRCRRWRRDIGIGVRENPARMNVKRQRKSSISVKLARKKDEG